MTAHLPELRSKSLEEVLAFVAAEIGKIVTEIATDRGADRVAKRNNRRPKSVVDHARAA